MSELVGQTIPVVVRISFLIICMGLLGFWRKLSLKKPISSGGPALTFEKHLKIVSQLSSEWLIVFFRTRGVPGDLMFRLLIVFSNVIVDLTVSCRPFVFSQWMTLVADVI